MSNDILKMKYKLSTERFALFEKKTYCCGYFVGLLYRHEIEVHNLSFDNGTDTRDSFGYFYCRARCGEVFKTKTTRNRHVLIFLGLHEVLILIYHTQ